MLDSITVLKKAIYSLKEAAKLTFQSIEFLLREGAKGEIPLYTPMPEQLVLFSVDFSELFPPSEGSFYHAMMTAPPLPFRVPTPQLLELSNTTCRGLLNNGASRQSVFSRAVVIRDDGNFEAISTSCAEKKKNRYLLDEGESLVRLLACYEIDFSPKLVNRNRFSYPRDIEVTPDSTYVTRPTLFNLLNRTPALVSAFEADLPIPDAQHISAKLVGLRRLLLDLWEDRINEGRQLPSNEIIAGKLRSKYEFSKNLANKGAMLIKQSHIAWDQEEKREKLIAPYVGALIACADLHWLNIDSPDYYSKNKEMVDWLVSKHKFPGYLAEAGVGIIRPETATKGGRPRALHRAP
ncbi:hypothetical protein [Massilia oculi]|uniref:hypothetical protein n=1 Tax=Massilia oculi TaxID=945844 RepID=UPI001AAE1FD0|nr:hypothetical protein [Massilia oculi]